jgi:von Willebrand factor type A domain
VDGETISEFGFSTARAENLPLSTVLLIDHNGSMKGSALERTRLAAVDYVKRAAPQDRVGIIQFDDRIDLLSKVTSNKQRVVRLIRGIRERGDTALYDSVSAGVKAAPECGRKAILLMTDGRDTASTTTNLKDALQAANRANVPVFVVGGFAPSSSAPRSSQGSRMGAALSTSRRPRRRASPICIGGSTPNWVVSTCSASRSTFRGPDRSGACASTPR